MLDDLLGSHQQDEDEEMFKSEAILYGDHAARYGDRAWVLGGSVVLGVPLQRGIVAPPAAQWLELPGEVVLADIVDGDGQRLALLGGQLQDLEAADVQPQR